MESNTSIRNALRHKWQRARSPIFIGLMISVLGILLVSAFYFSLFQLALRYQNGFTGAEDFFIFIFAQVCLLFAARLTMSAIKHNSRLTSALADALTLQLSVGLLTMIGLITSIQATSFHEELTALNELRHIAANSRTDSSPTLTANTENDSGNIEQEARPPVAISFETLVGTAITFSLFTALVSHAFAYRLRERGSAATIEKKQDRLLDALQSFVHPKFADDLDKCYEHILPLATKLEKQAGAKVTEFKKLASLEELDQNALDEIEKEFGDIRKELEDALRTLAIGVGGLARNFNIADHNVSYRANILYMVSPNEKDMLIAALKNDIEKTPRFSGPVPKPSTYLVNSKQLNVTVPANTDFKVNSVDSLDTDTKNFLLPAFYMNDDNSKIDCNMIGAPMAAGTQIQQFIPDSHQAIKSATYLPGTLQKEGLKYFTNVSKTRSIVSLPIMSNHYTDNHPTETLRGVLNIYCDKPGMFRSNDEHFKLFVQLVRPLTRQGATLLRAYNSMVHLRGDALKPLSKSMRKIQSP